MISDKPRAVWLLGDLAEARGKQELYTRQSPQMLKALCEHALIEENKDRYYETLEQSSHGWHQGRHDPWPYINYLLFILERAFREFELRVGETKQPKGAKAEIVLHAIRNQPAEFRLADIERACPGVGREWIRTLLADLKEKGDVSCQGKGPAARWRYLPSKGTTLK
jgi:hypothetical protein